MSQIQIYISRMPVPIHFSYHAWVVTQRSGVQNRFDVFGFKKDGKHKRTGHLYKNFHEPTMGCPLLSFGSYRFLHQRFHWKAHLLFTLDSDNHTKVDELIELLITNPEEYPYLNTYRILPGPNSNTFVQWVLDFIAPNQYKLPFGALGKNHL